MASFFTVIDHKRAVRAIDRESSFKPKYFTLLILSVILATLGLIVDNLAVVIGAMIIAPLMWPILATSLSIVRFTQTFFRKSISLLAMSIVLSVAVAAIVSLLSPILELNTAILSRTNPNIIDLAIALATGAVAVFVVLSPKSDHIAGVAVAASLIPPLSAAGISIALNDTQALSGAMLLFGANLFAIIFVSIVILAMGGFARARSEEQKARIGVGVMISFLLVALIAAPLGVVLRDSINSQKMESNAFKTLSTEIKSVNESARVQTFSLDESEKQESVTISANITAPFGTNLYVSDQNRIADKISDAIDTNVELHLVMTPTFTAVSRNVEEEQDEQYRARIRSAVVEAIKLYTPFARIDRLDVVVPETQDKPIYIAVVLLVPADEEVGINAKSNIAAYATQVLETQVDVTIQVISAVLIEEINNSTSTPE